jgi:putative membrane protein
MMWNGYGMMGYGWFWPFHFVVPLVIIGLIVWAVFMAVRATGGLGDHRTPVGRFSPGLDALDERYAKGEINRDEYLQKRRDILG